MTRVAICFLTKDRVDLSQLSIEPLVQPDKFDTYWIDGSKTEPGLAFFREECSNRAYQCRGNIVGGADTAVAYALTEMLRRPEKYTHVSLVENDVLLSPDWFDRTFALFRRGEEEGLHVGSVSARCYVDRILIQRDGYSVMHNLGFGTSIMTREAAEIALRYFRTGWTTDNRILFARLSGLDIGAWWAFGAGEHNLVSDWGVERLLAAHGLASLALTPSPVEMIGQVPPLADQGLTLAKGPVRERENNAAFKQYVEMTNAIRDKTFNPQVPLARQRAQGGSEIIFSHHLASVDGAKFSGDWTLKWSAGFGPFGWVSTANSTFECNVSGPCLFLLTGGERGGNVIVEDLKSGFIMRPSLPPDTTNQVLQMVVPASVAWRKVRLTCTSPGIVLYGIQCQEPQPSVPHSFDFDQLPPVA